jgi:hypothetical protein
MPPFQAGIQTMPDGLGSAFMTTPTRKTLFFVTACVAASAVALLVIDHWAHVFGVFPYVLLLTCPLIHLLHGGHGSHSSSVPSKGDQSRP